LLLELLLTAWRSTGCTRLVLKGRGVGLFGGVYDSALPLGGQLLSTLECDKGKLKVMRGLLKRCLLCRFVWLYFDKKKESGSGKRGNGPCLDWMKRTEDACNADNFFKSSEPRFAIARVVSVKSCLFRTLCHCQPRN
jgi:hypothetical protein